MLKDATIVFDLDGTLVDTAPDLTNALNYALQRHGHPTVAPATIREAVGRGALAMIREALSLHDILQSEDRTDAILSDFLAHYEANIAVETRPFPRAVAAIGRLRAKGARLAVCTNKREHLAQLLLRALDIHHHFAAIAGRDTFPVSKPDPGHLTGVIATAGGDPAKAIMVGDSASDILAARGANIPSIRVSFGYSPPPPEGPYADAVIDSFDELETHAELLLTCLTEPDRAPS